MPWQGSAEYLWGQAANCSSVWAPFREVVSPTVTALPQAGKPRQSRENDRHPDRPATPVAANLRERFTRRCRPRGNGILDNSLAGTAARGSTVPAFIGLLPYPRASPFPVRRRLQRKSRKKPASHIHIQEYDLNEQETYCQLSNIHLPMTCTVRDRARVRQAGPVGGRDQAPLSRSMMRGVTPSASSSRSRSAVAIDTLAVLTSG